MDAFHQVFGDGQGAMLWWQMVARALVTFVWAFLLFSLSRRVFGRTSPLDVVIAVMVGSALSRALTGNVPLLPAYAATLAMVLAHMGLVFLARQSKVMQRILIQKPLRLVIDGEIQHAAMRRGNITREDLRETLHDNGIRSLDHVKVAYLEPSGKITIVKN